MAIERLHLRDSLLLDFDAQVVRVESFAGKPSVVLDRTAFYAESGGQLGDRGVLSVDGRDVPVVDVQIDEAGDVHHLLSESVAASGKVHGRIEEHHRRDQMSQHTAQHMLSRALRDVGKYETVSARLGSETSTIDLNAGAVSPEAIAKAVGLVNEAVIEDRPIRIHFPTPEELAALPLSTKPKVEQDVRVIEVEGFDFMPCGGTHCLRTGQVGPVVVIGQEKYKGLTRITFLAGLRALRYFQEGDAALRELATTLTCARPELVASASRLKGELRTQSQLIGQLRSELMRHVAGQLLAEYPTEPSGTTRIIVAREGEDIDALRALASALTQRADVVALLASKDRTTGDWLVVAERGTSASFDAGRWLKTVTSANRGRGGGRPEHAEGRLPGDIDWLAVARAP